MVQFRHDITTADPCQPEEFLPRRRSEPLLRGASVAGASDRIRLGVIGTGTRGEYVMRVFASNPDVQVAGVCDVYQPNLDKGAASAGAGAEPYRDYRKLLERQDIDAILIAAPDHRHGPDDRRSRAGGQGRVLRKARLQYNRGWATAGRRRPEKRSHRADRDQQRSWPHFLDCAQWLQTGALGPLQQVVCLYPGGGRRRDDPPADVPEGLDWETFRGARCAEALHPRAAHGVAWVLRLWGRPDHRLGRAPDGYRASARTRRPAKAGCINVPAARREAHRAAAGESLA